MTDLTDFVLEEQPKRFRLWAWHVLCKLNPHLDEHNPSLRTQYMANPEGFLRKRDLLPSKKG